MTRIRVLPSDVVNKIAAGEVVERPASVVKEMVENALDAGASKVEVDLIDGGRELIKVADDGSGMSRDEALLSLERHATSKLVDADGLWHIASFGFRGEAVPAIASVARVTLTTCEPGALEGTRVEIEGGALRSIEPCGAPQGTTFSIRDLFYAVPARRKFLKRAETETAHASEALIRLALARPDVSFTMRSNGRIVFQSKASPDVRERIAAAIGNDVHGHLLPVEHGHGNVAVRGFVASPEWHTATNRAIYTFVNGRFVRDRQLLHAIAKAYAEVLPSGRQPAAVIFVDLPPQAVDVNVHPQKLEVRFAEPRVVYEAVFRGISDTLRRTPWLQPKGSLTPPAKVYEVPVSPQPAVDWHLRARQAAQAARGVRETAEALWPRPDDRADALQPGETPDVNHVDGYFASLRYIGLLARSYLLCEAPGGALVILDQHAARERLALHGLRTAHRAGELSGQPFLFPATLELGLAEARALVERLPELATLGFELEPFGGTTFALKAVPAPLVGTEYPRILAELARALSARSFDDALDDILGTLACHAAARIQQAATAEEARTLLDGLDAVDFTSRSPHGKVVRTELALDELR